MSRYSVVIFVSCFAVGVAHADDHVSAHKADIDALRSFGAFVQITPSIDDEELSLTQPRIAAIIVRDSWCGNDRGVRHIENIFSDALKPLPVVIFIGQPKISADRVEELRKNIPKSCFARRSAVALGIMLDPSAHTDIVRVGNVKPDSPAGLGGIRPGDTIIAADKTEIGDLTSLTEFMISAKAGQTVHFTVRRDTKTIRLAVKLKEWSAI